MMTLLISLLVIALMIMCHIVTSKLTLNFGRCDGFARIKLGPLISDIRGRVKENIFSIWKTGVHYVRSAAGIISNPQSFEQALIRDLMSIASKRWYDTLTAIQRQNWNEYAAGLEPQEGDAGGILNIIPQNRGIMSGFNAYCMAFTMVRKCDITLGANFDDAPIGLTPPGTVTGLGVAYVAPIVTLTWTDPAVVEANAEIRIWMRSHENICHRQARICTALAAETQAFNLFRGANGAPIQFIHAPGHYLFQLDVIQDNGLKSNPSTTVEVVVV